MSEQAHYSICSNWYLALGARRQGQVLSGKECTAGGGQPLKWEA
jgi:hypothetical protein